MTTGPIGTIEPLSPKGVEQSVLGRCMEAPAVVGIIRGVLPTPDRFSDPRHQVIYAALIELAERGDPTDAQALKDHLEQSGNLAQAGGALYLLEVYQAGQYAIDPTLQARIVAREASLRRVAAALDRGQAWIGNPAHRDDLPALLAAIRDEAAQALADVTETSTREADPFINGAAFVLDAPAEVPAIWGRGSSVLWARGEALMIVGGNGVGKTTLAHQLVAARLGIRTDDVLGYPIVPGARRVLYLACDRPRQIARAMQRLFTAQDRDILTERLVVWQGPPPYDFAKNTDTLAQMCEKAGADTVVVDSLKDVAVGLSDDQVGAAYNRARQKAIAEGVEVIELHHQKKAGTGGGTPNTLSDVYGSVWITAGAGSVILLEGKSGDPIVAFKHLKQPADAVGPFRVVHDHETGLSTVEGTVDLLTLARNFPHGMAPKAAAMHLFDTDDPSRSEIEKARRKLDKLVSDGLMVVKDGAHTGRGSPPKLYFRVALREVAIL